MSDDAEQRRAEARLLWSDLSLSVREISRRTGIPGSTLRGRALREGWPKRPTGQPPPKPTSPGAARTPQPPSRAMLSRLYRLVNHNIKMMEKRKVSDEKNPDGAEPDRNMRMIGNTVRSIEKMKDLEADPTKRDTAAAGTGRKPLTPDEEDRLREEIVERLIRLRDKHAAKGNDG